MENGNTRAAEDRGNVRRIVMTGLLAALTCVATMIIKIATPTGGYVNLGDTMVLLSAYLLGPVYGALAAGIGSALADLLNGYLAWVPATLVIKAAMALVAALVYKKLGHSFSGLLVCGVIGEIIMVVGYWLFESWMMNSFSGAAVGIPANMVQAAFGLVAATLLATALRKSGYVRREFPEFE